MKLLRDYIQLTRLNRPIGIWLLLFPGFAGLSVSQSSVPLSHWGIFLIGAIAMRSAGCIYNDIIDRPFDGNVDRTKNRPLVRVNPLSLRTAYQFLFINLLVGLLCLLQLNTWSIIIGFGAAAFIAAYPWMKRITYWPQLFLGFTMNMGFIMGFVSVTPSLNYTYLLIYLGMVAWTLGYDTIYGFQDMNDDVLIGIKSSTFKLKHSPRLCVSLIYTVSSALWLCSGILLGTQGAFFAILGIITLILGWQALTLNPNDPSNCQIRFKSNQWVALLLWLALTL